jgi:methyltransferase-like protein
MILERFNGDYQTKEALIEYIHEHINTTALERMYKGDDVTHIKDAKELIDGAFEALREQYSPKVKQHVQANEAK